MSIIDISYYSVSIRRGYSEKVKTFGIMFSRSGKENFQTVINCNLWEVHKLTRDLVTFQYK